MPFDPTLPAFQAPDSSEVMRNQLNGLKELIDAVPAGPEGPAGVQGEQGEPGPAGADGEPGPQGEPFASAVVDDVTTLDPGEPATVDVSLVGDEVHFNFGIPRGTPGDSGTEGSQGPAGEVSAAQLADAIATTSANTNAVATLDTLFADPADEAIRLKLNELIIAQRR